MTLPSQRDDADDTAVRGAAGALPEAGVSDALLTQVPPAKEGQEAPAGSGTISAPDPDRKFAERGDERTPEPLACDLLVIGSGAGGLSAAVTAAILGLDVVVAEKAPQLGGTTAWSGGWMWIPRNPLAQAAGIVEDPEAPRAYLEHELGDGFDAALIGRFLEQGPRMVAFFQRETAVQFIDGNAIPDFHGHSPNAGRGGRSVCAAPFDGRALGAHIRLLRPPLDLVSPFGMGIAAGADLRHFLNATRAVASLRHVARRLARHAADLLRHRRGMHLVAGNALVARLLRSALDHGVRLLPSAPAEALITDEGAVRGARLRTADGPLTVHAARGVILATGGFPHDHGRIADLFGHREHHSAAPRGNTGDGIRLGEQIGAELKAGLHPAAWAPVSLVPRPGGEPAHFPHLIERAKPGLIMVRSDGNRFCNEADSYHDVMAALFAATPPGEPPQAWMICDHRFIRRYGLGRVRPRPFPLAPWLRLRYLRRGPTIPALAAACGIDPAGLERTVTRFSQAARRGEDPEFGRGDTQYNRIQGEAEHGPNPCVAPIEHAPFYALRIVPGSLGTFAGLRTDDRARVLDAARRPIPGLYAAGNDMASIMAGRYPAGGITLGPAMTFGFIAAHDAAGIPLDNNRSRDPA